ncbi:putative outer membrane protein [Vibrio ponticus]|nr:putative outer membrane protein [Vibrio ponticus]
MSGGDLGANAGSESQVLFGLGFTFENLYLAGTYSQGDIDDKATGNDNKEFEAMEFVAQYQFSKEFSAAALYTYQENELANGSKEDDVDGIELVGYYKFNSNFRTYLSYYINNLDELKDAQGVVTQGEDTLRLGVRYDF